MKLTAIRGIEPDVLRDALAALLEAHSLDGHVILEHRALSLRGIRLREHVYNYLAYYNDKSRNWYATIDEGTKRPVCKNSWSPGLEHKPKRAKYLQWRHWARLDNAINELLDELSVACTFQSAYGVLRRGADWRPICFMEYTLVDNDGNEI